MDAIIEKVYAFTDENALIAPHERVLAAVSGGADSMALLSLLHRWQQAELTLAVVHVHHGIRGAEADRDAAFVTQMCREWHIPLFQVRADVPAIAAREHLGLEEAGRNGAAAFAAWLRNGWLDRHSGAAWQAGASAALLYPG